MDEPPGMVSGRLLEQFRSGSEDAADDLVRLLYPMVRANVRRHIRYASDHDDVAQEIFMKLFLKIEQYKGPQPFEHWVSRLAVNTCYDWLRKKRARPLTSYADLSENEERLLAATISGDMDGDTDIRRELLAGLLEKLIDGLKPREQIVIRLLDIEDQSIKEVCDTTGWSASKVKMTAMRARTKLADRLRHLEQETGS